MGKSRLLIVEDDADISNMLKIYFNSKGFDVDIAARGGDAFEQTRRVMPHLIILDIMLPDIDGYEVCRRMRTYTRTSHIPVIFLTQKDERSDKLQGLELGADDYVTKPFDIEELRLRVQNAISRAERESLTDPQSGLPAGRLIEENLRKIIQQNNWAYIDIKINNFEPFKNIYGFIAASNVLRFTGMLLGEVVDELGSLNDFIGHAGSDNFIIITSEQASEAIVNKIKNLFSERVATHYNFMDLQQGYLTAPDDTENLRKFPFMTLSIGMVSPSKFTFSDIREITELAAEERRKSS